MRGAPFVERCELAAPPFEQAQALRTIAGFVAQRQ